MSEQLSTILERALKLKIVEEIFERLERELPPDLRYHTVEHSHEVLREVIRFATADNLSEQEVQLLTIAAAYHDSGFIVRRQNNEEVGAQIAGEAMKRHGYSQDDIQEVHEAILSTQLKPVKNPKTVAQIPSNKLAKYLIDADVANFGKREFFNKALLVYTEVTGENPALIDDLLATENGRKFLQGTYTMVQYHQWYTNAAKQSLEALKRANLAALAKMLR